MSAPDPSLARVRRRAFRRVLARRCPQCGEGALFRSYARVRERCETCDLVFRREAGSQTGSMYLTAAVTEAVAALLLALGWLLTDWEVVTFLLVAVPLVLLFSAWFLPVAQAFWIGVEYATDAGNGESWVRPRP